jgi:hypothetical protein
MTYSQKDVDRIRALAEGVAAIAHEPGMKAIKKRWADVNALRKPDRAPVWCRPVGCWSEIITDTMLECADPGLRKLEYQFLQTIHKRDIDDDSPVEDYFSVSAVFKCNPANTWGVAIGRHLPDVAGGSWRYDPPIKTAADLDKLQIPTFSYCEDETHARMAQLEDLLGGILPVRLTAGPLLGATLGGSAADLRGLEQMMMDMIAEPELMHRLMAHLRDATLAAVDQIEATGLITPNNDGPMSCSDPIGDTVTDNSLSCRNLWCMANSQEFDQVSPAMWDEFCLQYQAPIFARFGLVGYGCCENLTHKIDGVLSIPNLRIFVCSAWTDLNLVLERIGRAYCIMWRQKASDVVFPDDPNKIKNDLMAGTSRLQGHYYQIVLRELETLAGHPDRLHEWTRYAKEAAEKYS